MLNLYVSVTDSLTTYAVKAGVDLILIKILNSRYYTDFSIYNPYLERLPVGIGGGRASSKQRQTMKYYDPTDNYSPMEKVRKCVDVRLNYKFNCHAW